MVLASNYLKSNDLKDNFLQSAFSILRSKQGVRDSNP